MNKNVETTNNSMNMHHYLTLQNAKTPSLYNEPAAEIYIYYHLQVL